MIGAAGNMLFQCCLDAGAIIRMHGALTPFLDGDARLATRPD